MANYIFNFTDPTKDPITVRPFTADGTISPASADDNLATEVGAVTSSTSLLLYGKGVPQYGERIQEGILQVMENFAGPTPPVNPTSGQLWFSQYDYVRIGTGAVTDWYHWNGTAWDNITVRTVQGSVAAGEYWFDSPNTNLYFRTTIDHTSTIAPQVIWPRRQWIDMPAAGIPTDPPHRVLKAYDGADWVTSNSVFSSDNEPLNNTYGHDTAIKTGDLWYDTSTSQLKIYNGTMWTSVADQFLQLTGGTMQGDIDMDSNRITNIPTTPTTGTDAVNQDYVDAGIAAAVISAVGAIPLNDLSDVTLVGTSNNDILKYNIGAGQWQNSTIAWSEITGVTPSAVEIDYVSGATSNIQAQLTDKLSLQGGIMSAIGTGIDMNGTRIQNVPTTPLAGTDAVNRDYVDVAVAGGGSGFLALAGGTMESSGTGINMDGTSIINLPDTSIQPLHAAASKGYIDSAISSLPDVYVDTGSFALAGSPAIPTLILTRTDLTTTEITGMADYNHDHAGVYAPITHTHYPYDIVSYGLQASGMSFNVVTSNVWRNSALYFPGTGSPPESTMEFDNATQFDKGEFVWHTKLNITFVTGTTVHIHDSYGNTTELTGAGSPVVNQVYNPVAQFGYGTFMYAEADHVHVWISSYETQPITQEFVSNVDGSLTIDSTPLNVHSLTINTWTAIGASWSTGTFTTWSALNGIPQDADWIEVQGYIQGNTTTGVATTSENLSMDARLVGTTFGSPDTALPESTILSLIGYPNSSGNMYLSGQRTVKIPLVDGKFEVQWDGSGGVTTSPTIGLYLMGWGKNQ